MTRWYEDIVIGEPFPLGAYTFAEADIIRFGQAYDPQYFHTDPQAAKHGPFGGLVASGWHTASVGHRLMVDALVAEAARIRREGKQPGMTGPSPGVNKAEFKVPVRPGDTLTYELIVTDKRLSGSLKGWGVLINVITGANQHGEIAYRAEIASFLKRRDYRMPLHLRVLTALAGVPVLRPLLTRR